MAKPNKRKDKTVKPLKNEDKPKPVKGPDDGGVTTLDDPGGSNPDNKPTKPPGHP